MSNQPRVSRGVPSGGQYTHKQQPDSIDVRLAAAYERVDHCDSGDHSQCYADRGCRAGADSWWDTEFAKSEFADVPPELLEELQSPYNTVRARAAADPRLSAGQLSTLFHSSDSSDTDIHGGVSENPNTSRHTLSQLARHEHYTIRRNVAAHLNTGLSDLVMLLGDEDDSVRERGWSRLYSRDDDRLLKAAGLLAQDPRAGVRRGLAERIEDESILSQLADDPDHNVRYAVANNMITDKDTQMRLWKDENQWVSEAARKQLFDLIEEGFDTSD